MSSDYLEPFPTFVDSHGPFSPSLFASSQANPLNFLTVAKASAASDLRSRIVIPSKVSNYFRLRYYQYEVTFGLYVMTPIEKLVLNTIVLTVFTALFCGALFGLQPLLVRSLCRLAWYVTGTLEGIEHICAESGLMGRCMP